MTLNQFMHPRNIYRKKRNFAQLGTEYPEFGKLLKHFPNGNATIDYKDPNALRILTQTLLKKDFMLDVELPPDRLVPAVPQRLNYVLWIEDLVSSMNISDGQNRVIHGIDIGIGASCIFPFLICRNNKNWKMLGTEIDTESLRVAEANVRRNDLSHRISLVGVTCDTHICEVLEDGTYYHFLMCNPPFFQHKSEEDVDMSDGSEISQKSPGNMSSPLESTYGELGEVGFCKNLMRQSFDVKTRIGIFSVMIGKKKSLEPLKQELKQIPGVRSWTTTEFCQGKTMRWGIAWSFSDDVTLSRFNKIKKTVSSPLMYTIPYKPGLDFSVEGLTELFKSWISGDLEIDTFDVVRQTKKSTEIWIRCNQNKWSHQRRKRRGAKSIQMMDTSDEVSSSGETSGGFKRKFDDEDDDHEVHQVESAAIHDRKKIKDDMTTIKSEVAVDEEKFLLDASIVIKKEKKSMILKMDTKEKSRNKETTYQLFQYFKNKLSVDAKKN